MDLQYEEHPDYQFPYWLNYSVKMNSDDLWLVMDINAWAGESFGDLGETWGYLKTRDDLPTGGAGFNLRNQPYVHHSWRFKEQADAALFKLTWAGK